MVKYYEVNLSKHVSINEKKTVYIMKKYNKNISKQSSIRIFESNIEFKASVAPPSPPPRLFKCSSDHVSGSTEI